MVELRILGRLQVVVDGCDAVVGPVAQQRLVIRLGLAGSTGLSVDRLREDLGVSGVALRTAVSRLRKSLGPLVVTLDSGYRLDAIELDADRFERAVAAAPEADAADRVVLLDEALGMWRGRALDGFEDEPWAQPVAARLEELRMGAHESRAAAKLALGRHVEAIAEARALIADHPLCDGPRGVLMRSLAAVGRSTEALRAFQEYRTLLLDEVGTEPGAELRTLDTEIVTGQIGSDAAAGAGRRVAGTSGPLAGALPMISTSFVGRRREHEALTADLGSSRLVTLVGVGGVGKTRLAVEVARDLRKSWSGGARFADLTEATHDDEVVDVVRDALGVAAPGGMSVDQLVEAAASDDVLLVLDNCEHVIGAVAALAELFLWRCPGITVLATSREGLGVPGERMHAVAPLAASGDALALFLDRAKAVDLTFVVDDQTRPTIEAICTTLDGIPLAIELAAARVRGLSVSDIAEHLDDRFRLLSGVRRTAVDRHRTLSAALDWSFQLLSPVEQHVLIRLGVFARTFRLADAEAVSDDPDAAVIVPALVDKSLLTRDADGGYRLLETIKHYCLDKLGERGELDDARRDHADHVLAEMRAAVSRVNGSDSAAGARRVVALFPELRAANQWAASTDRLDLAMDLCASVESVFMLDINLGLLAADVSIHPGARLHPSALVVESFTLFDEFLQGTPPPVEQAQEMIERHLAGEPSSIVSFYGPSTLSHRGEHDAAVAAARRIYDHWSDEPDGPARRWGILAAPYFSGDLEYVGEWSRVLDRARRDGSDYWVAILSTALARLVATSDPRWARELVTEHLRLSGEIELPLMTQTSLVTYVLLLDLDGGNGRLDERVSEVIAREIARSRHGYRLRAQHYLVFGALLTVVGEHELAARALAAHDALGTPTSARTRALLAVARSHLDDHLARAGVAPAPAPEPSDLPALVGRIQTALLGTVSPATRPADEPRRPPVAEPSRGGSRRSAVAGP